MSRSTALVLPFEELDFDAGAPMEMVVSRPGYIYIDSWLSFSWAMAGAYDFLPKALGRLIVAKAYCHADCACSHWAIFEKRF